MYHAYQVIFSVNTTGGGKTTALLTRAKNFNRHGINTDIVTFNYNNNYPRIIKDLKKTGRIDKNTNIYNQFTFLEEQSLNKLKTFKDINKKYKKMIKSCFEIRMNEKSVSLFESKTGQLIGHLNFGKNKKNYTFDIYSGNTLVRKVYVFDNKIKRINEYENESTMTAENFYNSNGKLYLRRHHNRETNIIDGIYLFSESKYFNNNKELSAYFLDQLIEDKSNNIVILDGAGSIDRITNTNHKLIQKYAVMHTTYKNPKGKIKQVEDEVLKKANELTGVVFLTNAYMKDAVEDYQVKNGYVINNFIKELPDSYEFSDSKAIGCISRLAKNKGFNYLIEVAKIVKEQDPEIVFHIYGDGPYKEDIEKMIAENSLEENVKLMGYTKSPFEILKEFRCVISTSQSEAQGLSLLESMMGGKPVISFDIKYGPSDYIFNNENGYLIPNKDVNAMAEAVIDIVKDENKYIEFGKNSREIVKNKFEPNKIINNWLEAFDSNK